MASNFPNAVDSFINPQYTKVNGVDFVKAEHVNDLQDAVKNVQLSIIGSGLSIGFGSNNYVPSNADIKTAIEILDGVVFDRETEHDTHLSASMPTDPFQHHSNVIQVTAIGNLNATRLQYALEELQNDIDNIMTGGAVESISLDNRYLLAAGPATVTGSMTVQGAFTTQSNVTLGSTLSNSVTTSGDLSVGRNFTVNGTSLFNGDIQVPDASKIGAASNMQYSHLAFGVDFVNLHSIKDIEFKLDSDDPIDGLAQEAEFRVLNGIGNIIMNLSEAGDMNVLNKISSSELAVSSQLEIGSSEPVTIQNDSLSAEATNFLIQTDSNNASANDWFAATQNGDNGNLDTSTDLLLKAKENEFIAGNHILKRTVPETGYFGFKFYSDNAGGRFHGQGVNFKARMLTPPSSVTLNIDLGLSSNYNNVSITDLNEYGFFVECDSLAVGNCELKGTYQTVGN